MPKKVLLPSFSSPIGMQLVSEFNENAWHSLFVEGGGGGNSGTISSIALKSRDNIGLTLLIKRLQLWSKAMKL